MLLLLLIRASWPGNVESPLHRAVSVIADQGVWPDVESPLHRAFFGLQTTRILEMELLLLPACWRAASGLKATSLDFPHN